MIRIEYSLGIRNEGSLLYHYELSVDGHAGSAEKGKDLVCCAVSTLTGTLLQCLDDNDIEFGTESDENLGFLELVVDVDELDMPKVHLIFMTIITGLRCVSEEHPDYVTIQGKEF